MDRSKIISIVIALACVAGLVALSVFGSKLDAVTNGTAHAVLAGILWQVKPAYGGDKAPPTLPGAAAMLLVIACLSVVASMPFALGACGPGGQVPPELAKAAAVCISHRTAKQLECVDLYSTRAEIDACRATVERTIDCVDGGLEVTFAEGGGQ